MTSSGVDALGLHVPHEVHEVAAVGLDRVVRQQRVADPGHQGPGGGRGIAAGGLQGPGQEGLDLGGGRGVAFQEVAPLGQEGRRAGRGGVRRQDGGEVCRGLHREVSFVIASVFGRDSASVFVIMLPLSCSANDQAFAVYLGHCWDHLI